MQVYSHNGCGAAKILGARQYMHWTGEDAGGSPTLPRRAGVAPADIFLKMFGQNHAFLVRFRYENVALA